MSSEFPPNSNSDRDSRRSRPAEKEPEKVVRQVTVSKARVRRKPLHRKFIDAFRPEDNKSFFEYIVLDQLVPGIKDAVADASTAAIDNLLGVDNRRRSRSRSRGSGSYTNYNRMPRRDRDDDDRRGRSARRDPAPGRSEAGEIILDTKDEALEVLDQMFELLSKYRAVTMRDLLSLVGEPHTYTDEDWGWTDLRGARVHRVSGGYLIDLPRSEPLD